MNKPAFNHPLEALRYHVSGAVERGEAEPIVNVAPAPAEPEPPVLISPAVLRVLADVAIAAIDDLASGLADGTYEEDAIADYSSDEIDAARHAAEVACGRVEPEPPAVDVAAELAEAQAIVDGGLPGRDAKLMRDQLGDALRAAFPCNAIRNSEIGDVLIVEDDRGREWSLLIQRLP